MWGCIKPFPVKPRKQIKMWLWEIAPVKHNSRTGQTRHFLFLWGDSLPSLKMMKCLFLWKEAHAPWVFRWELAICMHQLSHNFLVTTPHKTYCAFSLWYFLIRVNNIFLNISIRHKSKYIYKNSVALLKLRYLQENVKFLSK